MAEVFRAEEPRNAGENRVVVIKRMLPSLASEPGARAMFDEEARFGRLIQHPNVVRVLGSGHDGEQAYLVLEYVPGLDLWRFSRWLTRSGRPLGVELTLYVVRALLAGLHAVHEARDEKAAHLGLVHRDVSPSNILLSVHGDVKLGDFGIAQARLRENYPQAALPERAKGKLGYMAPEQVRGAPADRRADVFAAAVIAAELLMGRPLFAGGSELGILLAIREAHIRPFEELIPSLPKGLGEAIAAALARDPAQRTSTARALYDALEPFATAAPGLSREQLADLIGQAQAQRTNSESRPNLRATHPWTDRPPEVSTNDLERTAEVETDPDPTAEHQLDFFVQCTDGSTVGPLSFAKTVEAVAMGRIGATDRVAQRGHAFIPLHEHPDLSRHVPASSLSELTARREPVGEPVRSWRLEGGMLIEIMARLAIDRVSGLLLCEESGARKEIYLSDGVPEFVASNLSTELLGEYLVAQKVLSRGELDMALAVMPRFEGRLGETLTALELVEPVQLFQHIAEQVEEKLLDLFAWPTGEATLWLDAVRPQGAFPLGLDPWSVILNGIGRRIERGMGMRIHLRSSRSLVAQPLPGSLDESALPPTCREMLRMASQPVLASELMERFEAADPRRERVGRRELTLLVAAGAIRWT